MESKIVDLNEDIIVILNKKLAHHMEQYKYHKKQVDEIAVVISTLKENKGEGINNASTATLEDKHQIKMLALQFLENAVGGQLTIADVYKLFEDNNFDLISKMGVTPCKQYLSQCFSNWAKFGYTNSLGEKMAVGVYKDEIVGAKNQYFISTKKQIIDKEGVKVLTDNKIKENKEEQEVDDGIPPIGVITTYKRH